LLTFFREGRRLVDFALEAAKKAKAEKIYLHVQVTNEDAILFYKVLNCPLTFHRNSILQWWKQSKITTNELNPQIALLWKRT
jgi:hypothetical protein